MGTAKHGGFSLVFVVYRWRASDGFNADLTGLWNFRAAPYAGGTLARAPTSNHFIIAYIYHPNREHTAFHQHQFATI